MGWWKDQVVPHLVEVTLRGREIDELRSLACEGLHGRVLELGFGSGLNVRWYPERGHPGGRRRSVGRGAGSGPLTGGSGPRSRSGASVVTRSASDVADATYDAALVTFTSLHDPRPRGGTSRGTSGAEARREPALPRARRLRRSGRRQVAAPPGTAPETGRRRMPPDPRPCGAHRERRAHGPDGRAGSPPRRPEGVHRGLRGRGRCADSRSLEPRIRPGAAVDDERVGDVDDARCPATRRSGPADR